MSAAYYRLWIESPCGSERGTGTIADIMAVMQTPFLALVAAEPTDKNDKPIPQDGLDPCAAPTGFDLYRVTFEQSSSTMTPRRLHRFLSEGGTFKKIIRIKEKEQ